jgi:hypothetical protein
LPLKWRGLKGVLEFTNRISVTRWNYTVSLSDSLTPCAGLLAPPPPAASPSIPPSLHPSLPPFPHTSAYTRAAAYACQIRDGTELVVPLNSSEARCPCNPPTRRKAMWGQGQGGWAGAPAATSSGGFAFGGGAVAAPSSAAFGAAPLGMPAASAAFPAFGVNPLAAAPPAGNLFGASTAASSSAMFPAASSAPFGTVSSGFTAPLSGASAFSGFSSGFGGLGSGALLGSATLASAGGGAVAPAAQAAKAPGTSPAHAPCTVPLIVPSLRFPVDTEKKPKVPAAARALARRDAPHNFPSAIGCSSMAKLRSTSSCADVALVRAALTCCRYAPPVQPFHSAATYQPLIDKALPPPPLALPATSVTLRLPKPCACASALPAVQAELSKAFQQYKDDFDTANVM